MEAESAESREENNQSAPGGTVAVLRASRRRRTAGIAASSGGFLCLMAFLCYIGVFGGNVRTVQPGRVYRSSQLTGNTYEAVSARLVGNSLNNVINTYGIRTVINLRGGSLKDTRYADELAICSELDVKHVDIPFSALHLPSPDTLERMLYTFDQASYPLLIHCQGGSDRTGLASTIYAYLYEHLPLDQAENEELTWRYGHIRFSKTRAMDTFFDLYRQYGHGKDLRKWIYQDYPDLYARYEPHFQG